MAVVAIGGGSGSGGQNLRAAGGALVGLRLLPVLLRIFRRLIILLRNQPFDLLPGKAAAAVIAHKVLRLGPKGQFRVAVRTFTGQNRHA